MELFASPVFVESKTVYFGSLGRLKGQRNYPKIKMRKKLSEKFVLICEFISQSSTFLFMKLFANTLLMESAK